MRCRVDGTSGSTVKGTSLWRFRVTAGVLVLTSIPVVCACSFWGMGDWSERWDAGTRTASQEGGDDAGSEDAGSEDAAGLGIHWVQTNASNATGDASVDLLKEVTARNAIVVAVAFSPANPTTTLVGIHDSLQNNYEILLGPYSGFPGHSLYLAAAFNVKGGPDTVELELSGAPTATLEVYASEYSGIAWTDAGDSVATGAGNAMSADASVSVSVRATTAGELVYAFFIAYGKAVTSGSDFATRSTSFGDLVEDRISDASGPVSVTSVITDNGAAWAAIAATLRSQ
jgi:hypothetical protein